MTETSQQHFECTPNGVVESSRRRLRRYLMLLAVLTLVVAAAAAWMGRTVPMLLAVGAAGLALFSRRMSADLDPLWLELTPGTLAVQMRRQRQTVPLISPCARRLQPGEIEHLTSLATIAGLTAGTGGFDSHLLGEFDLYATDLGNAVLVEQEENSVVVTPDHPEPFLLAINATTPARIAPHD